MDDELFGPLLPVLDLEDLERSLEDIRRGPKPLALYLFGGSEAEQRRVLSTTSSGGVCLNDVVMQAGVQDLPFGGVGGSGMGSYHGKAGFDTFSHAKAVLRRPFRIPLGRRALVALFLPQLGMCVAIILFSLRTPLGALLWAATVLAGLGLPRVARRFFAPPSREPRSPYSYSARRFDDDDDEDDWER